MEREVTNLKNHYIILAIRRKDGETRFNPTAHESIRAGDYLIAMGEPAQLATLETLAARAAVLP